MAEAETLIFAMQPHSRRRRLRREVPGPDAVSVLVDGAQVNLGEVMQKVSRAFDLASAGEVN